MSTFEFLLAIYSTTLTIAVIAVLLGRGLYLAGTVPRGQELGRMKLDKCDCPQVFSCCCHEFCQHVDIDKLIKKDVI